MRNWASLVTNRELFTSLLRIYLVFFVLMFLLAAWGLVVTFGIFHNVDFNKINPVINPYGLFISTVVFLIPYSLVLLYYILDLHYLMEEMEHGTIKELGKVPKGTMDLTGVSQACLIHTHTHKPSRTLSLTASHASLTHRSHTHSLKHPPTHTLTILKRSPSNPPCNTPFLNPSITLPLGDYLQLLRAVSLWDTLHGPLSAGGNTPRAAQLGLWGIYAQ